MCHRAIVSNIRDYSSLALFFHHSDLPEHYNTNYGTNLSLWDWMFGTLYVTNRKPEHIRFGTGDQDADARYSTLYGLIVLPFVEIGKKLRKRRAVVSA